MYLDLTKYFVVPDNFVKWGFNCTDTQSLIVDFSGE